MNTHAVQKTGKVSIRVDKAVARDVKRRVDVKRENTTTLMKP